MKTLSIKSNRSGGKDLSYGNKVIVQNAEATITRAFVDKFLTLHLTHFELVDHGDGEGLQKQTWTSKRFLSADEIQALDNA